MEVAILDRAFSGRWAGVQDVAAVPLLGLHWRGSKTALQRRKLARAQLTAADGTSLRCEFVLDAERPSGVCEEIGGGRLYYLAR